MAAALQVVDNRIGSVEAEMAVLGALLCDHRYADAFADAGLGEADFSEPFFGSVYATIQREHLLGRSLNSITLRPFLENDPRFEEVGGNGWLASLTVHSLAVVGAMDNCRQVIEDGRRRRLVEGLRTAIDLASDYNNPVAEVVLSADQAITEARVEHDGIIERSAAECLDAVIEGFDNPLPGVECRRIPSIDSLIGPARPTHLIIGAGRPGMGKTAAACSYAIGIAEQGEGVLFFSLEMGGEELAERMASDLCFESHRIPYEAIRDRRLNVDHRREICRARDRLGEMPLQIIDKGGLKLSQLRFRVRRWKRRFAARGINLALVVVDYLQLLRTDRVLDRQIDAVSEISRTLKEIAKDEHVAVLALSQLSRKVEEREDKRPRLADLRESGQIEQDADTVLFFLRDEYYLRAAEPLQGTSAHADWEAKLERCQGRIEFICAKRRAGRTGALIGEFLGHFQAVRG